MAEWPGHFPSLAFHQTCDSDPIKSLPVYFQIVSGRFPPVIQLNILIMAANLSDRL